MLTAKLFHLLGQLKVHVVLHATGCFLQLWRVFTNQFRAHWALGGERLSDRLSLKPHNRLGNHGVEHAASALPRLGTLFDLQAKEFETVNVCFLPLFAGLLVLVHVGL